MKTCPTPGCSGPGPDVAEPAPDVCIDLPCTCGLTWAKAEDLRDLRTGRPEDWL